MIPVPDVQVGHWAKRGANGGRPYAFDARAYRGRDVVERTFNKLMDNRAFAMRTDKRGDIFAGTVAVAALRIWLRDLTRREPPDTPQAYLHRLLLHPHLDRRFSRRSPGS